MMSVKIFLWKISPKQILKKLPRRKRRGAHIIYKGSSLVNIYYDSCVPKSQKRRIHHIYIHFAVHAKRITTVTLTLYTWWWDREVNSKRNGAIYIYIYIYIYICIYATLISDIILNRLSYSFFFFIIASLPFLSFSYLSF